MIKKLFVFGAIIVIAFILATATAAEEAVCTNCDSCESDAHAAEGEHEGHNHDEADADAHEGHDHDSVTDEADHDEHAGHDHDANEQEGHDSDGDTEAAADPHAGHDHEAEAHVITLDSHEAELIELGTARAGKGKLTNKVSLTGQVKLNDDRLAHIVPQVPGIVKKVDIKVGAKVKTDQIIAWLDSSELGQAKIKYLDALGEISCCSIILTRAEQVHVNVLKLLELLEKSPELEDLRELNALEMGEYRSTLISTYAEYSLAKLAFDREAKLYKDDISSEQDYLTIKSKYKTAEAKYLSATDTTKFKIKSELLEARRVQQVGELQLKAAKRTLYVMGLLKEDVAELDAIFTGEKPTAKPVVACADPNCADCLAKNAAGSTEQEPEEVNLARYALRAPFDGIVIEKHISLGERLEGIANAFSIADLNTVWVDLDVYQKDMLKIKTGQKVTINFGKFMAQTTGTISYVSNIIDTVTRTATARIVLDNKDGMFKPGLFVSAEVISGMAEAKIAIARNSIVTLEGEPCIFVRCDEGFEARFVTIGRKDNKLVEIIEGLATGEEYVIHGAFDLKAKIVTSTLGSHAGHGH